VELHKTVGEDLPNGNRKSGTLAGHICFGPYLRLGPGRYFGGYYLRVARHLAPEQEIDLDIYSGVSDFTFANRLIRQSEPLVGVVALYGLTFELTKEVSDLEVRLRISDNVGVEVNSLVIFPHPLA
jgi:hypothetical protein